MNIETIRTLGALNTFIKAVMAITKDGMKPSAFRGQKCNDWDPLPSIFRDDNVAAYKNENLIVRELISAHPYEFESDKTMFDRLVRMQHYQLPTRLLDVTINPLVALWFATELYKDDRHKARNGKVILYFIPDERVKYYDSDTVSCLSNLANLKFSTKLNVINKAFELMEINSQHGFDDEKRVSIFNDYSYVDQLFYQVGMEKPHFRSIINPEHLTSAVYVKPKMSNKRIAAQSGSFLLYPASPYMSKDNPREKLTIKMASFEIQANKKETIRKDLEKLGIHGSSLFPELDRSSGYIIQRLMRNNNENS